MQRARRSLRGQSFAGILATHRWRGNVYTTFDRFTKHCYVLITELDNFCSIFFMFLSPYTCSVVCQMIPYHRIPRVSKISPPRLLILELTSIEWSRSIHKHLHHFNHFHSVTQSNIFQTEAPNNPHPLHPRPHHGLNNAQFPHSPLPPLHHLHPHVPQPRRPLHRRLPSQRAEVHRSRWLFLGRRAPLPQDV